MAVRDKAVHLQDRSLVLTDTPLGTNQAMTPEGFLLCRAVPIARTGWQDYLNDEIVAEGDLENPLHAARSPNGVIRAERREEDVFRDETLSSFEGKPVVDDHPPDPVHPGNFKQHVVGFVFNVRRGDGAFADFILADMLIMDQAAIDAVRAGKREVSCGYDAEYEYLGTGRVRQFGIIGNHVALVDRGRCGFRCAIGDEEMKKVAKKNGGSLVDRLRRAFAARDQAAFDEAVTGVGEEEEMEDEASEKETMEATGTNIHIHLGGEESAKGKEPAEAGAADEEEPEAEAGAAAANPMEGRIAKIEAAVMSLAQSMQKLAARLGDEPEAESEGDESQQGEAEAEGVVPEADEEPEEEEGKKKDKSKDMKKDKAAVADSAHLKDDFADAKSGAEILAPGLKMPTFDKAASPKVTDASICLLKRRALAAATRTADGKEVVDMVLGKQSLNGMACDTLATVFNGAVALMKDRNMQDDPAKRSRGGKSKSNDSAAIPTSPRAFNALVRERYKQPAPR